MSENILSIIVGGAIAIVSGGLGHLMNNYFQSKGQKKKYVFEKLEDIIESASSLEQMIQADISGVLNLVKPSSQKEGKDITFQINKLECLIKIYHKPLTKSFEGLKAALRKYLNCKVNILNLERSNAEKNEIVNKYNELMTNHMIFSEKMNEFIQELSRYGNSKIQ